MTDIVDAVENVRDAEFASDTNEYSTLTEAVVLLLDQRHEIERLRAIISRMDGLTDDARSALAIVRQAAREALGDD